MPSDKRWLDKAQYTSNCPQYKRGKRCKLGDSCTFMHGANDTRSCVIASQQAREKRLREQPKPPHKVKSKATAKLLDWLTDRLHADNVGKVMLLNLSTADCCNGLVQAQSGFYHLG
eukprot:2129-Heterococcus_DN1.PRE.4